MEQLKPLEDKLVKINKDLPAIPANGKKTLAGIWPILALIGGVIQILAAWGLYTWGHNINKTIDAVNSYASAFGVTQTAEKLSIFYWISLLVLVIDGVILLMAYPGLKAHKKSGWDLLFVGALVNLLYGIVSAFNGRGGGSSLVSSLIGSALGLYLLFQIRDEFLGAKTVTPASPTEVK